MSAHKEQTATGRLKRKQTPTTPSADTLGDDDSSSDNDQLLEQYWLWKNKNKVPPGFLAPISRKTRPSTVDELVAPPPRDDGNGNSPPCEATNSPKRMRSQNDERKNNSSCSDNSQQPNIAEEINGHALQKILVYQEQYTERVPAELDYQEQRHEEEAQFHGAAEVLSGTWTRNVGPKGRFAGFSRIGESTQTKSRGSSKATSSRDNSWMLSRPAPGGPDSFDVIPSFGGHVAYDYWETPTKTRALLKIYPRQAFLTKLKEVWPVPPGSAFGEHLKNSGLFHLSCCLPKVLDMPLLCAFIERWQPDTNSFHMPFGEMTIMLHDVEQILMLSSDGVVCGSDSQWDSMAEELFRDYFPFGQLGDYHVNGKKLWQSGGFHSVCLMNMFSGCSDSVKQAQIYLLCLLGATLFVDKTSLGVKPTYLSLLTDLESVNDYAWGAGTLAYLYRSLGFASRAECKMVDGCLALLQCWIYEHFPGFAPGGRARPRNPAQQAEPRSIHWRNQRGHHQSDLAVVRQQLDHLSVEEVNWMPYGPDQHVHCPRTVFTGVIRCMDILEPYHPDRCLRQLGYVQTIPRAAFRPDDAYRGRKSEHYKVKFLSGRLIDQYWSMGEYHCVDLRDGHELAVPPHKCARDYLAWFRDHSHPLILPSSAGVGFAATDRNQLPAQIGFKAIESFSRLMLQELTKEEFFTCASNFYQQVGPDIANYVGQEYPAFPPPSWGPEAQRRRYDYDDEEEED